MVDGCEDPRDSKPARNLSVNSWRLFLWCCLLAISFLSLFILCYLDGWFCSFVSFFPVCLGVQFYVILFPFFFSWVRPL